MKNHKNLEKAKKRVAAKLGLYIHTAVFVLVMLLLLVINLVRGEPYWVIYPFLGWGLGLAIHAIVVFLMNGYDGDGLYDRYVQAELDKIEKK